MYKAHLHKSVTVITLSGRTQGVLQFIDQYSITVGGIKIQKKLILQVIPG